MKTKKKSGEEVQVEVMATSPCAFCKGEITLGYEGKTREPVTFHSLPICEKFGTTEMLQFLEENRLKLTSN